MIDYYKMKQCETCKGKLGVHLDLLKRKTKPYTATNDGHLYFDYYQCPKCKTNYAYGKKGN